MKNKFFTYKDDKLDKLIFDFTKDPILWWSRIYEYCWALNEIIFELQKEVVIADMACGTFHPFKFALASFKQNKVYACDLANLSYDNIINDMTIYFKDEINSKENEIKKLYDKISWRECDISNTQYDNKMFDIITCISVFEHLDKATQIKTLKEWHRVLKDDGKILLTCDSPFVEPYELIKDITDMGFEIDGERNYDIGNNCISIPYNGEVCKVFSMILKKIK